MREKLARHLDYILILCVLFLVVFSVLFVYSSAINSDGILIPAKKNLYIKQLIWGLVGFLFMITLSFVDYRKYKRYIPHFFGFCMFLLLLVFTLGFIWPKHFMSHGARSWLGIGPFGIQPSEFSKIAFIMFLAWFLEKSKNMDSFKRTAISLVILGVPVGLILMQPDFGTAMIYIPVFFVMCFVANIPIKYIAFFLISGTLVVLFTFIPLWQEISHSHSLLKDIINSRIFHYIVVGLAINLVILTIASFVIYYMFPTSRRLFYWIIYFSLILLIAIIGAYIFPKFLSDYQIKRLIIFLNPEVDRLGAGWNITNSKIAIGSGNFLGKGFLLGSQSHLQYLPEQSTDFIFSIIAEETGFIGGIFLFAIYFAILLRMIYIVKNTLNECGYYIGVGIIALLFFHFIINIGMVMGIMPVTGIPLLFISYGGSSMLASMIAIGIIMSIRAYKFEF